MITVIIIVICLIGLLAMAFCFLGMRQEAARAGRPPAVGCLAELRIQHAMRQNTKRRIMTRYSAKVRAKFPPRHFTVLIYIVLVPLCSTNTHAQSSGPDAEVQQLRKLVTELQHRIERMEAERPQSSPAAAVPAAPPAQAAGTGGTNTSSTVPSTSGEPFSFADWTWLNGNPRTKDSAFDSRFFTPEVRADVEYTYSFNHPADNTIAGSSEVFRANEVQVTQLGVGGDFHLDNVRARMMTQFGMYSETTPRNDASTARGQWNLDSAYRHLSEAYGGYHIQ